MIKTGEKYAGNKIQGWMNEDELQWLFEQAEEMESIVEVGSWKGRSTHALLSGCKGKVVAVDHFQGSPSERMSTHFEAILGRIEDDFVRNVGQFPNLTTMAMDSDKAVRCFEPKSVDMVFIDGDHVYEQVLNDLMLWRPIAKKLFCGHDYGWPGINKALKELRLDISNPVGSIWRMN